MRQLIEDPDAAEGFEIDARLITRRRRKGDALPRSRVQEEMDPVELEKVKKYKKLICAKEIKSTGMSTETPQNEKVHFDIFTSQTWAEAYNN